MALTGAGISAESGVPTFRDAGGLWRSHRPEELATIGAFERDPRTVWEWYEWRRGFAAECEPNDGHRALARFFLRRGAAGIVTQNVDGLHTPSPRSTRRGTVRPTPRCPSRSTARSRATAATPAGSAPRPSRWGSPCPAAPRAAGCAVPTWCSSGRCSTASCWPARTRLAERADLCLVIGTSAVVYPAAGIPLATLRGGGSIIEVNPEPTELTGAAAVAVAGGGGVVLPVLLD